MLLKQFNEEHANPEQLSNLYVRNAVRVVIVDDEKKIRLYTSEGINKSVVMW